MPKTNKKRRKNNMLIGERRLKVMELLEEKGKKCSSFRVKQFTFSY